MSIIKNMKTIWDNNNKEKDKEKIHSYFSLSERIFFIGFGWLDENMKILGLDGSERILRGKEVHCTALQMSDDNVRSIEDKLKFYGALRPNISSKYDALTLIKDFF